MNKKREVIYQPSVYVPREPGESASDFTTRVLADPRLLPDQRTTLQADRNADRAFDVRGIWIERPPIIREPKQ